MLTAESQKGEVQKAINEGVNDYIVKPFKKDALMNKVNSFIQQKFLNIPPG